MLKRALKKMLPATMGDRRDPALLPIDAALFYMTLGSLGKDSSDFEALPEETKEKVRHVVSDTMASPGSHKDTAPDGSKVWACGTADLVDWGVERDGKQIARGVHEYGQGGDNG